MISLHDSSEMQTLTCPRSRAHIAVQHAGPPPGQDRDLGAMTTLANFVSRLEGAVRRAAAERYAEQRERIARTGGAGMI
ncbi:hypothetical protein [Methylobacterium sp. D48H]